MSKLKRKANGNSEGTMTKKTNRNNGKRFEQNIKMSLDPSTYCYRLRDSPAAWGKGKGDARFTPTNLCDFIIFYNCKLYMLEAKSTKGKSLPFKNIRESQILGYRELLKFKDTGVIGVFAIQFSDLKVTYLISSEKIIEYIDNAQRKSLPLEFFEREGIKLEIHKGKRVRLNIEKGLLEL